MVHSLGIQSLILFLECLSCTKEKRGIEQMNILPEGTNHMKVDVCNYFLNTTTSTFNEIQYEHPEIQAIPINHLDQFSIYLIIIFYSGQLAVEKGLFNPPKKKPTTA